MKKPWDGSGKSRPGHMAWIARLAAAGLLMVMLGAGCAAVQQTGEETAAESQATQQPAPAQPDGNEGEGGGNLPKTQEPEAAPSQAQIPEQRLITVEWPATIRQGDSETLRLTLEMDETGALTPTAEVEGHEVSGKQVVIPNLYDTHNVVAEARLDLAGMEILPGAEISETLRPGQDVTFYWSVRPERTGDYRGTLWLHLHFIPKESAGEESRIALTAQRIEIRTVNMLGLGGTPARVLGAVGTLAGSIIGLDNIASWIWGAIRRRRGKDIDHA